MTAESRLAEMADFIETDGEDPIMLAPSVANEHAADIRAILSRLSPAPAEGMGEAGQEDWPVRECGPETEAIIERDGFFLNLAWTKKGRDLTCRVYEPQLMRLSPALADVLALTYEDALAAAPASPSTGGREEPIKMILFCPACGLQHIDEPEEPLSQHGGFLPPEPGDDYWENPPHRSHLCHGCGHIWRPADVPTEGVAAIETNGKADSPPASPSPLSGEVVEALEALAYIDETLRLILADKTRKGPVYSRLVTCGWRSRQIRAALASLQEEAQ